VSETRTLSISLTKRREIGLPTDQPHTITVPHLRIAVVTQPNSPFNGELVVYGRHFFTLDTVVAMLVEQIEWESLDYFAIGKRVLVMKAVAERLRQLIPDSELAVTSRRAAHIAGALSTAVDPHKTAARDHALQAVTLAKPGYSHQTQAAHWADLAASELAERERAAGRLLGIAQADLAAMRELAEIWTAKANAAIDLLRQPVVDANELRRQLSISSPAVYKPWIFFRHVDNVVSEHGRRPIDAGLAGRLADSLEFEGSLFWLTRICRRITNDNSEVILQNRQQLIARINRRIRFLRGFDPLDVYRSLITTVIGELEACRQLLSAGDLRQARHHAKAANRWLRYRLPGDPDWYPVAAD
jgi:hypothetical protein